jgi:hypothetical protein
MHHRRRGTAYGATRETSGLAAIRFTCAAPSFTELDEPCALAAADRGANSGALVMACAAGVVRWHPAQAAVMLRWRQPMALDKHWVPMLG